MTIQTLPPGTFLRFHHRPSRSPQFVSFRVEALVLGPDAYLVNGLVVGREWSPWLGALLDTEHVEIL